MLERREARFLRKRESASAESRGMQLFIGAAVCAVQREVVAVFSRRWAETECLILRVLMNKFEGFQEIEDAVDRHRVNGPSARADPKVYRRDGERFSGLLERRKHHPPRLRIAVALGFEEEECGFG